MDQAPNFEEMPYAEWLEGSIRNLSERKVRTIAIIALLEDGDPDTMTAYYLANMEDKAIMAMHIFADAMYSMVEANALRIMRVAQEQEEEEDGEDD